MECPRCKGTGKIGPGKQLPDLPVEPDDPRDGIGLTIERPIGRPPLENSGIPCPNCLGTGET